MLRLKCDVKHNQWGKLGSSSKVAQLMPKSEEIDENKHYSELWMGTHHDGPSVIVNDQGQVQQSLHDYINTHPGIMASKAVSRFVKHFDELPFLFKVVAVGTAQPIQSHPKPKMAIALTDFELLCGVRKPQEIKSNVEAHPELVRLIGGGEALRELVNEQIPFAQTRQQERLKDVIKRFWTMREQEVQKVIDAVVGRLSQKENRTPVDDLVIRLNQNSPGNLGVLAPLFHHHVTLKPGQAIFIEPDQPCVYLTGDCIECMGLSTNKPSKYQGEAQAFCRNLNNNTSVPHVLEPRENPDGTVQYSKRGFWRSEEGFAVQKITKSVKELGRKTSDSILIVIQGEAKIGETMVASGDVFFLPRKFQARVVQTDNNNTEKNDFIAFRAYVPPQTYVPPGTYFCGCSIIRAPEHDEHANWDAE